MTTTRTPFADLPRSQQAGILSNSEPFRRFVAERLMATPRPAGQFRHDPVTAGAAAEFIQLASGVNSRADLDRNPAAAERFDRLRTEFDAWRGAIPPQRKD